MSQSLALLDLVRYVGDAVLHVVIYVSQLGFGKELLLLILVEGVTRLYYRSDILLRQRNHTGAVCSGYNIGQILRVKGHEFILAYSAVMNKLSYMEVASYMQGVGLGGTGRCHGAYPVLLVETHGVIDGDECRQITACLAGQVGVDIPEITLAARTCYGLCHIAGTAVVGRNGK